MLTRCAFERNRVTAYLFHSVSGIFNVNSGTLNVRDSHFVDADVAAVRDDGGGVLGGVLLQTGGTVRFANCSFLGNSVTRTVPNKTGLFLVSGGAFFLSHCALAGTALDGPSAEYPTYDLVGNAAVTLTNSVILNAASDYAGVSCANLTSVGSFIAPTDAAYVRKVVTNGTGLVAAQVRVRNSADRVVPTEPLDAFGLPRGRRDEPGPLAAPLGFMLLVR